MIIYGMTYDIRLRRLKQSLVGTAPTSLAVYRFTECPSLIIIGTRYAECDCWRYVPAVPSTELQHVAPETRGRCILISDYRHSIRRPAFGFNVNANYAMVIWFE